MFTMVYGAKSGVVCRPTSRNSETRVANICTGLQHIHCNRVLAPAFLRAAAY